MPLIMLGSNTVRPSIVTVKVRSVLYVPSGFWTLGRFIGSIVPGVRSPGGNGLAMVEKSRGADGGFFEGSGFAMSEKSSV